MAWLLGRCDQQTVTVVDDIGHDPAARPSNMDATQEAAKAGTTTRVLAETATVVEIEAGNETETESTYTTREKEAETSSLHTSTDTNASTARRRAA